MYTRMCVYVARRGRLAGLARHIYASRRVRANSNFKRNKPAEPRLVLVAALASLSIRPMHDIQIQLKSACVALL